MQKIIGLILAGGLAKRFGSKKCLATLKGKYLIQWSYEALKPLCDEIWLSITPKDLFITKIISTQKVIFDKKPGSGPFIAFLQALEHTSLENLFLLAACDQPLLVNSLLKLLIRKALNQPSVDAVICIDNQQKILPFPGVYSPRLVNNIPNNLKASFRSFLGRKNIKTIPPQEWQKFDPTGLSFFNINYKKDLILAEKLAITYLLNQK